MSDDAELLRQYVDARSETAFAELVRRHLALVYHSAVRQLGDDAHLAPDVAQGVFVLLAEKSRALLAHPSLAAWLHTTTHFKVSEVRRAERRRRTRDSAAHLIHELMQNEMSSRDWERLRPMIDEVLLELNDNDREAVLLRFFEARPFAEIAARLRLSENTAHKRVERALEKLRERLARRGVTSTAAAIATALAGQAAVAAPPAGLAASVTSAVMASGVSTAAAWSVATFMSTKTAVTAVVLALAATGGIATQQLSAEREAATILAAIEQENATLAAQLRAERERRAQQVTVPRPTPATQRTEPRAAVSAVAETLGSGGLASVEESRAFLRANPDLREALSGYYRDTLGNEYADIIQSLRLTEPERERFLAILAKGSRRIVGEHQLSLADTEVTGAQLTEELRELLGDGRYQQYREFRRTGLLRDVTREMTRALYYTPAPLTSAHAAALSDIVARAVADPALPKVTAGVWPYIPIATWERIINDAQTVLAAPQVEALRELQQQSRFWHAQQAASAAYRAAQSAAKEPGK